MINALTSATSKCAGLPISFLPGPTAVGICQGVAISAFCSKLIKISLPFPSKALIANAASTVCSSALGAMVTFFKAKCGETEEEEEGNDGGGSVQ